MAKAPKTSNAAYSFRFMHWHRHWLGVSLLLIVASLAGWMVGKPNFGIDFTGGLVVELRSESPLDLAVLREKLEASETGNVTLQHFGGDKDILIRLQAFEGEKQAERVAKLKQEIAAVAGDIPVDYRKVEYVGPQVGEELRQDGVWAAVLAFLAIMVYVWFRFEWQFGLGALFALLHDAVLALGLYLILPLQFDLGSIAAVLTILGYSVNDSVVIYDRIRENLRKYKKMPLPELIDLSLNETLSRTILTGGTTLLALTALVLFGGPVIRDFCLVILLGVVIGTYSSIFISAPVLLYFGLKRDDSAKAVEAAA